MFYLFADIGSRLVTKVFLYHAYVVCITNYVMCTDFCTTNLKYRNDDRPTIAAMVDDIHQISHFMKELETLGECERLELEEYFEKICLNVF